MTQGNIKFSKLNLVIVLIISCMVLTSCGGGGGLVENKKESPSPKWEISPPDASDNNFKFIGTESTNGHHAPVYETNGLLRVGVDQKIGQSTIDQLTERTEGSQQIKIRSGTVDDGVGSTDLQKYFSRLYISDKIERNWEVVITGTSNEFERKRLMTAVEIINTALPDDFKLTIGDPISTSLANAVLPGLRFDRNIARQLGWKYNTIHVEFLPLNADCRTCGGASFGRYIQMYQIDHDIYTNETLAIEALIHELMHSLGFHNHVDEDIASVINAGNHVIGRNRSDERKPGSLLYPIDRAAIRFQYENEFHQRFGPRRYGDWNTEKKHMYVDHEFGAFGAVRSNGYTEPWSYGIKPDWDLIDNTPVSSKGSATWKGVLVGYHDGHDAEAVGDSAITVNFPGLDGTAEFDNIELLLESDQREEYGDLDYDIQVSGNTYVNISGDDGTLTGTFIGRKHEATGGVLERSDLSAAFGGIRE